jgi:hypothetical protein
MKVFLAVALFHILLLHAMADISQLSPEAAMHYDVVTRAYKSSIAKACDPVTKLTEKFLGALEKRKSNAQVAGQLDQIIAIDKTIAAVNAGQLPEAETKDSEAAKLTKIYLGEHTRLTTAAKPALDAAAKKQHGELEILVSNLTKDGKIDDAKIVREELAASVAATSATAPDMTKWKGVWDVSYENKHTRRLRIEVKDATTLKFQVISGTWESGARYTARYEEAKKGFYAEQVANEGTPEGTPPRCEVYTMEGNIMRIRHWIAAKDSYEHPTVIGSAKLVK